MNMNNSKQQFKRGGVSMFLVVVAAMLISLMGASFLRTVLRDQTNATNQDLSQSAYDSAMAGVEDAKRFLNIYNKTCKYGAYDAVKCPQMENVLRSPSCNMMNTAGIGAASGETKIQTTSSAGVAGATELDQAYTCVKITRETNEFLGKAELNESKMVPLQSTKPFNQVKISWHSKEDLSNPNNTAINYTGSGVSSSKYLLPSVEEWNKQSGNNTNRPAIMKAQFIGAISTNNPTDLDNNAFSSSQGNGLNEMLYYPRTVGSSSIGLPTTRRSGSSSTTDFSSVKCETNLNTVVYACSVIVNIGFTMPANQTRAYLRLTPIYTASNFKVELFNGSDPATVPFDGVQPKVDSTGRANDKFRRVESRLEFFTESMNLPQYAVTLEGSSSSSLCKNFWVSNADNNIPTSCN